MTYEELRNRYVWEVYTLIEHYQQRQNERLVEFQVLAGIALNPHTKKPLAPDKLIKTPSSGVVVSDEEKKADLKRKMEAFKRYKNGVNK